MLEWLVAIFQVGTCAKRAACLKLPKRLQIFGYAVELLR